MPLLTEWSVFVLSVAVVVREDVPDAWLYTIADSRASKDTGSRIRR